MGFTTNLVDRIKDMWGTQTSLTYRLTGIPNNSHDAEDIVIRLLSRFSTPVIVSVDLVEYMEHRYVGMLKIRAGETQELLAMKTGSGDVFSIRDKYQPQLLALAENALEVASSYGFPAEYHTLKMLPASPQAF
jgi:hypothetical protein